MLQHFGNFRVILRVNLTGRSRAKILQLQRQSQFLVHVFSQNRKLHRADFQYLLMKAFQIKVFAKEGLLFFFQIQKIQISHIVFQIISRCFGDISVNLGRDSSVTDSEKLQEASGLRRSPAVVMDSHIQQGVNAQIHAAVQPGKSRAGRSFL